MLTTQQYERVTHRTTTAQKDQRRLQIIDEFFRAYQTARYANPVFTNADDDRIATHHTTCVSTLGLLWPCTEQDVRQAFRARAKALHPDMGGSSEAFQALYQAYQEALDLVGKG